MQERSGLNSKQSLLTLPLWSQVEELHNNGILVAQREHKEWVITLYALHNQLYERWSNNGMDFITNYKATAKPLVQVEPYLEAIIVEEL